MDITPQDRAPQANRPAATHLLVPMAVGDAVVYVASMYDGGQVVEDETVYPVAALPDPRHLFEYGVEAIRECVRVVGDHLGEIGRAGRPDEVRLEFSLGFEAGAQAHLIPVLFTGSTKANAGLKVIATWRFEGDG